MRKTNPKGVQHESILAHFGVHLGSFWIHFEAGGAPGSLWAALGAGVVKKREKVANFPPKPPPKKRPKSVRTPQKIFRRLFCVFVVAFFASRFWERKRVVQRGSKSTKLGPKAVTALCETCAGMAGLHSARICSTFCNIFPPTFSRSFFDCKKRQKGTKRDTKPMGKKCAGDFGAILGSTLLRQERGGGIFCCYIAALSALSQTLPGMSRSHIAGFRVSQG